ncbi:phasin family protein [Microvirga roseola]|uniref:phasin family protein n=1 Tax=Microvirga roseola TaxID=2883126 RepID=UPI001E5283A6|nr:phasin family protein [Microvirga roseola]
MAEPKKMRTRTPKAASAKPDTKPDLVEMAAVTAIEIPSTVEAVPAPAAPAPKASARKAQKIEAGTAPSPVREHGDALRLAMGESLAASARGALEVSDKVIDALQSQSHAALDLWRGAFSTPHLPEAFHNQASAARQAYETASAQWKDIAETAARWMTRSVEPLQSALQRPMR